MALVFSKAPEEQVVAFQYFYEKLGVYKEKVEEHPKVDEQNTIHRAQY